jgi:dimethylhistidine N-methyltransferase
VSTIAASHAGLRDPELAQRLRGALGTRPRRLPVECFYDDLGSALFEAITYLPEYGLTRAEWRLLCRHSSDIARLVPSALEVVELGSGSGRKTRLLLEALARRRPLPYRPVDISAAALEACRREMAGRTGVTVDPLPMPFLEGLSAAIEMRAPSSAVLVLFLGSNVGNLEPPERDRFLSAIRRRLRRGDALLITADLEKDASTLEAAYDDDAGVTAAFNRNALARLNRELGADFDLAAFRHRALYAARERRIEMHLVSERDQTVRIPALGLVIALAAGETIWTESSYKFRRGDLAALGRAAGFSGTAAWQDDEWPFELALLVAE